MGKLKKEVMAHLDDDMGMPALSEDVFMDMFGADPIVELDNIMVEAGFQPTKPSAYEVEKAHYDMWLWELTKYDDIHLIKELEDRGYDVRRAV